MNFINNQDNDDLDNFVLSNIKKEKEKKEKEKKEKEKKEKEDISYKKCINCNKYHGYNSDNRCSICHIIFNKNHPDKDKYYIDENGHIKHISKKKYDLTYLNIFTEKRKLPNNHKLFTSLKNMFETGSFMEDDNFNLWLNFLKKTNYKGIDINQAIELSNISNNSGYQNVKDNYKIGHYICGLIIDWWKIRKNKISTVQCYYDLIRDDDPLPYFNTNIKCAALFDTKCNFKKFFHFDKHTFTETCPNYGKDIKNCKCEHNNRYYFCINNLF
tara:strand:+ start:537 stop:1349 length:813 start_codon:yes stop_codon:yes gene_type:complete